MTIRTKLRLSFLAMLGLPVVLGILFYFMAGKMSGLITKQAAALQIITATYEVNTLTHTYASSRIDRARVQALSRQSSLGVFLKEEASNSGGETEIIQRLLFLNGSMKTLFDRILINTERIPSLPPGEQRLQEETTEWLLGRLRGKTFEMVSEARQLFASSQKEIRSVYTGLSVFAVSVIVLVVIVLSIVSTVLYKGVAGSLENLRRGTEKLAAGDLDYRVDVGSEDETGMLASAFNRMADDLKSSHAALRKDIEERKQAEEALRQVQKMLESRVEQRTAHLVDLLEKLRESELKYRIVVEHSYHIGYWLSPEGGLVYISPSCKRITGHGAEEFLHDPSLMRKIVHPEDLPLFDRHRQEEEKEAEVNPREVQFRIVHADATLRWIGHVCRRVFDEQGRFLGIRATNRDMTEQMEAQEALRESEKRFSDVFHHAPSAMVLAGLPEGIIVEVNQAWVQMYGYTAEEAVGKTTFDLGINRDSERRKKLLAEVQQRGSIRNREPTFYTKSGTPRTIHSNIDVVTLRGEKCLLSSMLDITDRKQAEEALRRSRDELELRVRERTAELERKNQELQEFAFVASHDLSEPLRKIQTFGDLLKAKSIDRLGEKERDYVSRMTGAANRMQELLDALLRYSRVETQGGDLVPVNLENIVRTVAADLEVSINRIGAHVEIGPLPIIKGDPYQWRQVFQNLIANAVKYHRSEVKPVIRIHGQDGTGCIYVEDNGIGFDEKYLDRIFQPFQRLHGRNEYPGTGIGLAICKKIAERHGGTITARSKPGKGSIFIVTLAVDRTAAKNISE